MEDFIKQLSLLKPNSMFLTLKGYRNEHSEVADYNIVFHISYENTLNRSISILEKLEVSDPLDKIAKEQLLSSFRKSLGKLELMPQEELEDHYTGFLDESGKYIKGIKLHTSTNTLHLYGLVVNKKVIVPGSYPIRNRQDLTIAKDKLKKSLPISNFRQFKITPDRLDYISVSNLSLLPPAE